MTGIYGSYYYEKEVGDTLNMSTPTGDLAVSHTYTLLPRSVFTHGHTLDERCDLTQRQVTEDRHKHLARSQELSERARIMFQTASHPVCSMFPGPRLSYPSDMSTRDMGDPFMEKENMPWKLRNVMYYEAGHPAE